MNTAQPTTFTYLPSVVSELPLFAGKSDAAVKLVRTPDTPLFPRFFDFWALELEGGFQR
jgi:hypothetical protein